MKNDVFAQRDMKRRRLRKRLCRLYSRVIDGDTSKEIMKEIKSLRASLLQSDPIEVEETFEPKERRPRLPA